MIVFFDGGSKPNPGAMEAGIVVVRGTERDPHSRSLGHGTNNVAEWTAFLWALQVASSEGVQDIEVRGDSRLVVEQASGRWKINHPELRACKQAFDEMRKGFQSVKIVWVPRANNLAGLFLEGKLR